MSDGEWLYGYLNEALSPIKVNNDVSNLRIGRSFVRTSTIGQFTSLYDKNGKEIYEGDIIKHGTFIGVVDWHPIGNFFINENYGKRQDKCISLGEMLENHSFIVVGNIHDNPELLEGGEQ